MLATQCPSPPACEYGFKSDLRTHLCYSLGNVTLCKISLETDWRLLQITVASGRTISVGVWDTAGAEQFESLSKMYYHGSKAAIVCFDAARASSFDKLQFWVRFCMAHAKP